MVAIPAKLQVEKVEVVFSHSETFVELFQIDNIFFVEILLQNHFSVFVGDHVFQRVDFAVILDIGLNEDVAVTFRSEMVGQIQGLHTVEVQIRWHFFGVEPARKRLLMSVADDCQLV